MTSIAAGDLTKLREQQQHSTPYLSIMQPSFLLRAQVNDAAISRGERAIDYDNGLGNAAQFARITAGQTLWVGTAAGTYDVGKVRVKSIAGDETSGTITIAENGIDWIDDLFLTIIDFYDIWPIPPRIATDGTFYKDYDDAYVDENEEPPPVAIMGPHRAGFLSGGSLVFTLDGSNSYAIADGAAVTGYAWTATGGVIANAAIATTTITFSGTGYFWVILTVTDDNGKTQLTRRCYFIYDDTESPYRDFTISSCGGDWNSAGWSFSAEIFGTADVGQFPDGTLVVLWHQNYIDGSADNVNIWDIGDEVICTGYLQRDIDTDDLAQSGTGSMSITVVSPTLYIAQKNIMATVALEANSSPSAWNEYETWLSAGRAVHHLLRWHSTVIETCDVIGLTDNTLQVYQVAFTEDSLLDMVNQFAYERGIFAKLVSAKDGRLYFVEDSNYLDDADRTALDTIMTILAQDLAGTPQLAREPLERTSLAFLDGFDYDGLGTGDPFVSIIPGYIETISIQIPEFWGRGSLNKPRQILDSQADADMKTGRVLAVANNPLRELRLDFRSNYLGAVDIVPDVGWYRWGIANATLKRGLSLLNTDWLCRGVELRFPTGELWIGAIQVSVVLEGEAFGEDGIPGNYPTSYPTPTLPEPNWTAPAAGATYGYWNGGFDGAAWPLTTDRTTYSTGTTAVNGVSAPTFGRQSHAGFSDITTYGYWLAGYNGTLGADTALAERIVFSTGVNALNAVSDRTVARRNAGGLSDASTYAYVVGGGNGVVHQTLADRTTFTTGATAANAVSDFTVARERHACISDATTYGYFASGERIQGGADTTDTVQRITFSTGVMAAFANTTSIAAEVRGNVSDNSTYGYAIGGINGGAQTAADRITFATGVIAANAVSNFPVGTSGISGQSDGTTTGHLAGGNSGGYVATAYNLTFSTGVTAANAGGNLSSARSTNESAGISDGAV